METEAALPDLAETIALLTQNVVPEREAFVEDFWRWICGQAGLPDNITRKIIASTLESPAFVFELLEVLQQDPYTYYLVDKQRALPEGYEPEDIIPLTAGVYRLARDGLMLRAMAVEALNEMAAAAAREGISFIIGSAYRSRAYQVDVYAHWVRQMGQDEADRVSARPGHSQHQLGMVVDFFPISDAFALTPASSWLMSNASRFGWSLSYPDGYEEITGYSWESWHYRYVGKELAAFIDNYFEGIQQYALQFIYVWQEQAEN